MKEHFRKVSIAPMMDWTDKHFRYFIRLISKYVTLYTEMISDHAVYYNLNHKLKLHSLLDFNEIEHPIIFQVGGYDLNQLKIILPLIEEWGYDGINLNCGCPSEKVQNGKFGAILMNEPKHVAKMIEIIKKYSSLPVSIKHRIGIKSDTIDRTKFEELKEFVKICSDAGNDHFIIHARFAYLDKYNPKQNRQIPPLQYDWVYQIKQDFPHLFIEINGGIRSIEEINEHLNHVDAVMIGRAAYENPFFLKDIDLRFTGEEKNITRKEVFLNFIPYVLEQVDLGTNPHSIIKHTLGLFYGIKNSKIWKNKIMSELMDFKYKSKQMDLKHLEMILKDSLQLFEDTLIYEF